MTTTALTDWFDDATASFSRKSSISSCESALRLVGRLKARTLTPSAGFDTATSVSFIAGDLMSGVGLFVWRGPLMVLRKKKKALAASDESLQIGVVEKLRLRIDW